MTSYLGLTSLGFRALSVRSGLSQLCKFGPLRLDLCSPLVGHDCGRVRERGKPRLHGTKVYILLLQELRLTITRL